MVLFLSDTVQCAAADGAILMCNTWQKILLFRKPFDDLKRFSYFVSSQIVLASTGSQNRSSQFSKTLAEQPLFCFFSPFRKSVMNLLDRKHNNQKKRA
jgi:hypothetical protein